ncbi:hypothetical protein GCM10028811_21120 [Uliginosibacterium sediminicola]
MRSVLALLALIVVSSLAAAAEPSEVQAASFVLLTEPKLPEANAFRTQLEARLKGRVQIDNMEADGEKVILLRIRGGTLMIGLIEAPLPKGQIDDLCQGAWY